MSPSSVPASLPILNRERLRSLLAPRSLVVVQANDIPPTNADGILVGVPNSDLFYLSGIAQEETILLLAPDAYDERMREILFVRETNEVIAQWEGHKLTKEEARARSGIARVEWLSDFPVLFRQLMCEAERAYLNSNEHSRAVVEVESRDARFVRETQQRFPLHEYRRLAQLMRVLRLEKSQAEIELLKHAAAITRDGYARVMRFLKPGVNEREVEAEFAHEFIRQHGRFAYPPIVASGKNNNVLHYEANDQPCKSGDLLLLDVGASFSNYNADVTRALPVSGRFTPRQRAVYLAVMRVLDHATAALVPGKRPRDWQKECEGFMQEELLKLGLLKPRDIKKQDPLRPALKKYFMHGTGHPLGLDVHDVIAPGATMASGWVMTVEPGIYLPDEGFGIRLENDILITEHGNVNLTKDIPIEPEEVEAAMQGKAKAKRRR
jgi:Xaa-Pro aminopeptidase